MKAIAYILNRSLFLVHNIILVGMIALFLMVLTPIAATFIILWMSWIFVVESQIPWRKN